MAEANWGAPPAYGGTYGGDVGAPDQGGRSAEATGEQAVKQAVKPAQGAGFMNIFAAGLSLALLVGMGVWGYRLAVRDVTGVPVVRAAPTMATEAAPEQPEPPARRASHARAVEGVLEFG